MNGRYAANARRVLVSTGVAWLPGPFSRPEDAWSETRALLDALGGDEPAAFEVIGDFVLPPLDGPPSRDFQTLHFDFGLPLVPAQPADVARFTALHIPANVQASGATTRLVPLQPLLASSRWPPIDELIARLTAYGHSHGARDDEAGYIEGSLARFVEAARGDPPVLPSVKKCHDFLCGTEFVSIEAETQFFALRGLQPETVETTVRLNPGELLIFENLRLAHGRRGARRPGELRQRVFGHRNLSVEEQVEIRSRVLAAFANWNAS